MASEVPSPIQVEMQVRWPDDISDTPTVFANQFAVQVFQGNAIFAFGQSAPPLLSGSPEEQAEYARKIGALPVLVLARYAVPIEALRQIADALQKTVAAVDALSGGDAIAAPLTVPKAPRARPRTAP